jgi:hypothetical protein
MSQTVHRMWMDLDLCVRGYLEDTAHEEYQNGDDEELVNNWRTALIPSHTESRYTSKLKQDLQLHCDDSSMQEIH